MVGLMIGASILTPILFAPDRVTRPLPASVGVLAACVGYARLLLSPLRAR